MKNPNFENLLALETIFRGIKDIIKMLIFSANNLRLSKIYVRK